MSLRFLSAVIGTGGLQVRDLPRGDGLQSGHRRALRPQVGVEAEIRSGRGSQRRRLCGRHHRTKVRVHRAAQAAFPPDDHPFLPSPAAPCSSCAGPCESVTCFCSQETRM